MKKILPFVIILLSVINSNGQTPQHYFHTPSNVGVNNLGFNDGISKKFLFIYTQSEIASMVNPVTSAIAIDTIFFRSNTAYNIAIANFKITIGHTTLSTPVATFSSNFDVGVPQVVLNAATYNWNCLPGTWNVPADKWSAIPISKFNYDFVNNLAVMIEFSSTSYPEPLYSYNGGPSIIQYTPTYSGATATGTTARPMFGISSGGLAPVSHFQSSDTSFCDEPTTCINFVDLSTNNPTTWLWHFPGALPDSSLQQNPTNICYPQAGTYPVTLISTNASGSDTLTVSPMIIVGTAPLPPTLWASHDTVFCSHAITYQWYFNGNPIPNATDSFYVFTANGTYSVQISDGGGCKRLSSGLVITSMNDFGIKSLTFDVYPNPAKDHIVISHQSLPLGQIEIYDNMGKKIWSKIVDSKQETVNCKLFPVGIYVIKITDERGSYFRKFVKE